MRKTRFYNCEICGEKLCFADFIFKVTARKPKVKIGVPLLGLRRVYLCDECGALVETTIMLERKKRGG